MKFLADIGRELSQKLSYMKSSVLLFLGNSMIKSSTISRFIVSFDPTWSLIHVMIEPIKIIQQSLEIILEMNFTWMVSFYRPTCYG